MPCKGGDTGSENCSYRAEARLFSTPLSPTPTGPVVAFISNKHLKQLHWIPLCAHGDPNPQTRSLEVGKVVDGVGGGWGVLLGTPNKAALKLSWGLFLSLRVTSRAPPSVGPGQSRGAHPLWEGRVRMRPRRHRYQPVIFCQRLSVVAC